MKEDIVLNEEMKGQMMTLSLDEFFARVTAFMVNEKVEEANFTITGDAYECELHFKELTKKTDQ